MDKPTTRARDAILPPTAQRKAEQRGSRRGTSLATWTALGAAGLGAIALGRALWRRSRAIELDGRVVLITGGSRGLGLALAREFAKEGARLALCARDEDYLEWARKELTAAGTETLIVPCDIRDRMSVEQMIEQVLTEYGRIDVLVNNAGIITVGPVETLILEDFEQAMETIFWGGVYASLAVLPHMLARGEGRIVNITSIGGKVSVPHLLPYSAAKFAMVGFSEGLRAEVAQHGVSVVTVAPGLMRTGSPVNATFKGQHRAEYAWFSLGDNLPLTSITAEGAAQRIVAATRRGDPDVTLSPQAKLLATAHGVLPGLTSDLLGVVNRFLPKPGGIGQDERSGGASESTLSGSFLNTLGRRAELLYHQRLPERPAPDQASRVLRDVTLD
jgi:NAD(P)-dependent dehydrogenase (short-subunit alcohol dehydrogenase family)